MSALLILGGTAEARELAGVLHGRGVPVVSSLAGRVAAPRLPPGEVRIGGFGGREGLERWLVEHDVFAVVDATHPFATRMSHSAVEACTRAGVPLLRLERPGWHERPGDRWHWVADVAAAAEAVEGLGRRCLLALGRQEVAAFAGLESTWFLIRSVGPPDPPLPPRHELLLDRGPFTVEGELAIFEEHRVDVVVTRDSGGDHTAAKLDAARDRELSVLVVRRPPRPEGPAVPTVADAAAWAGARAASPLGGFSPASSPRREPTGRRAIKS
jgi:precorrin-6A/cobalt-precorrin-6A reductase